LRGRAEVGLGRLSDALATAGEILARAPARALEAKCLRARAYILRGARVHGRGEETEDFVKAYFDIQSFYPQALRGGGMDDPSRGRVFTVMGLYQMMAEGNARRAVEDFQRAVAAWTQAREAHRFLGRLAAREAGGVKPEVGLTHLEKALSLSHPDVLGIHTDRGRCYERLGRKAEASAAYGEALRVDPDNEEVKRRLQGLEKK
ncbi:MAG: tetratricopeptide repeat protein, partial [Planctomycetota bacterium]